MISNEALVKFANQDACDHVQLVGGRVQVAKIAAENFQLWQECTTGDLPNNRRTIEPVLVAH